VRGASKTSDKSDEFGTDGTLKTGQGTSKAGLPSVVHGVFANQGDQKVFVTDGGVVLKADNVTDKIGTNASSIRVDVTLKKIAGEATIDKTEADLPKKLAAAVSSVPTEEGRASLSKTVEDLKQEAPKTISSSSAKEAAPYRNLVNQSKKYILNAFMGLTDKQKDDRAVTMGAAYLAAHREERKFEKAYYGYDDQWSPKTYSTIFEWCNPIGRISVKDQPIGTCFLIGTNLVLTCEHCVVNEKTMDDFKLADLTVTFYKEGAASQTLTYPIASIVHRGGGASFGAPKPGVEKLDFAFLEVGASAAGKKPQQDGLQPVALEKEPELERDAAVYVVGYPGEHSKMIADNAHLFVPYEITDPALNAYRLELNGELDELKSAATKLEDSDEKTNQVFQADTLAAQMRQQFKASFKPVPGTKLWRFVSDFMYPQHPAIAIDTDTFHGNSGSPVFLRKTSQVIGLFFRGLEDADRLKKVTWRQHEEAVPISAIFEHWTQEDPSGPARYGIQPLAAATASTAHP
jgi:V8-like Glu-specific endopeptidase